MERHSLRIIRKLLLGSFILLTAGKAVSEPAGHILPEMVLVPSGKYTGFDFSGEPLSYSLSSFYIGKTEVIQDYYISVMGKNPSSQINSNAPVTNLSWFDAVQFCNAVSELAGLEKCYYREAGVWKWNRDSNGFRLPTEAEWEYAAKGGSVPGNSLFAGSNVVDDVAWYDTLATVRYTNVVGLKKPNELGLHDMSGNVWEWCWNSLQEYDLPGISGLASFRIIKGGSVGAAASFCAIMYKGFQFATAGGDFNGIRLVRNGEM